VTLIGDVSGSATIDVRTVAVRIIHGAGFGGVDYGFGNSSPFERGQVSRCHSDRLDYRIGRRDRSLLCVVLSLIHSMGETPL